MSSRRAAGSLTCKPTSSGMGCALSKAESKGAPFSAASHDHWYDAAAAGLPLLVSLVVVLLVAVLCGCSAPLAMAQVWHLCCCLP